MVQTIVKHGIVLVLLACVSLGCSSMKKEEGQAQAESQVETQAKVKVEADELSVMSFNIRYGTASDGENRWANRRLMVCDLISRYDCDLVGLQEALRFQIEEICRVLPEYDSVGVGREDGKTEGEYSAILYRTDRLELLNSGTFWLSDTPEVPGSITWGNACTRICTWGYFKQKDSGKTFYHFNTHFDHRSQGAREKSAVLIDQQIAGRENADPVVLTGDFNAGESNPAILYLKGENETGPKAVLPLVDTFRVVNPGATKVGTFTGFKEPSKEKIDYVFTLPGIKVLKAAIIFDKADGRYPSDHFPVMAKIELPN